MSRKVDFLIVGGGISGHLLQYELESRGKSTLLVDKGQNHSTKVAAGIVNPITGKYLSLTWRADEIFPYLKNFYSLLSAKFDVPIFSEKPILRIVSSAGEQNRWLEKSANERYAAFCSFDRSPVNGISNPFGQLNIKHGGDVKIELLIDKMKAHLPFHESEMRFDEGNIDTRLVDGIEFDEIVFCEGYEVIGNGLFNFLELTPNKGEMITIKCQELDQQNIYSGRCFVQPLGNHTFRVGATYERDATSSSLTDTKKDELIESCGKIINVPFEVVNHVAGIRPTTRDRRPLLGTHPSYHFVHLFNGMGSKGYSMVPLLANEMANYLLNSSPLHPETDLKRFC